MNAILTERVNLTGFWFYALNFQKYNFFKSISPVFLILPNYIEGTKVITDIFILTCSKIKDSVKIAIQSSARKSSTKQSITN